MCATPDVLAEVTLLYPPTDAAGPAVRVPEGTSRRIGQPSGALRAAPPADGPHVTSSFCPAIHEQMFALELPGAADHHAQFNNPVAAVSNGSIHLTRLKQDIRLTRLNY